MGKTVTTQFAWIDPPPTRNPWNLERTPGGSSSGSAVAVATSMCLGAIGTQTGGSIIRPSAFCGVVGYKPPWGTEDSLPLDQVLPFAASLDHVGSIGRTSRDVSLIHRALKKFAFDSDSGDEARDARPPSALSTMSTAIASRFEKDLETFPALILLRVRGFFDRRAEPSALAAFESALDLFSKAGVEVVDLPDDVVDFDAIVGRHRILMAAEAASAHEERFTKHREAYAPHIRALIDEGLAIPLTRYIRTQLQWRGADDEFRNAVHPWTTSGDATAFITPSAIGPAPEISTTGNPSMQAPWSYLGWPAVTIPHGLSADGLPLGLQLVTRPEDSPLRAACRCESILRHAHETKAE